ncbi:tetratricopeptide repeat protein [Lentisphaerota bacterium WC36G]|nr:sel1 repeat family protein [Lentisphaerae bacterium WC36]
MSDGKKYTKEELRNLFNQACDYYDEEEFGKAFKYWKKAADNGHIGAQYNVGHCFYNGEGVSQNLVKAFEYYKKAADNGDALAQYNTGLCYYKGEGVEKNEGKVFEYHKKAAEQGHVMALNSVGYYYEKGIGTDFNHQKAFEYFKKAADSDHEIARFNLACCYNRGIGVVKNSKEAIKLLKIEFKEKSNIHSAIFTRVSEILFDDISILTEDSINISERILELSYDIIDYFENQPKPLKKVFHFSSMVAFESILNKKSFENDFKTSVGTINSKENNDNFINNVLRLYDSIGMNDPSEGRALLSNDLKFDKETEKEHFECQELLESFYKDGIDTFSYPENESLHCFTASFTEDEDSLNLWRAYGNDGDGFCLEIDPVQFKCSNFDSLMTKSTLTQIDCKTSNEKDNINFEKNRNENIK